MTTSDTPPPPIPAPSSPSSPPLTADHINGLHARLDELEQLFVSGFQRITGFLEKFAPIIESAAAAVGPMLDTAGGKAAAAAAGVVDKVAQVAAAVACTCKGHAPVAHGAKGCLVAGCSCAKTKEPAPVEPAA